jgi:asparagine synthase (glutamine-hydrolysing)
MCGIAGIVYYNGQRIEQSSLKRMTDAISHRGPNGEGFWISSDELIGFGHRRLSILDITPLAKQPMSYANERLFITYNGEIYNFLELRNELKQMGYIFTSDSDTEVILASYHAWGKACLSKFNGMWAFAIWDEQEKELFLARDRFGIKPLYYLYDPGKMIAFGSETPQFKNLKGYLREFENSNLELAIKYPLYLEGFGLTIYKGIKQVLPGHFITIKNNTLQQKRWWSTLNNIPRIPPKYADQVDTFKELFFDSCKLRMRSDVSLASALSGGLDSSAVYCGIHYYMKNTSNTYRVPNNETIYANKVIDYIAGPAVYVEPIYGNIVDQTINSTLKFDSIYITPISVIENVYNAMQKDNIVVSLDGHGIDEMMFGYQEALLPLYTWAYNNGNIELANDLGSIYTSMAPSDQKESHIQILNHQINASIKNRRLFMRVKRKVKTVLNVNKDQWFTQNTKLPDWIINYDQHSFLDLAGKQSYQQFHHTTLPTILRNFDRAAMMSGIEIRMPFMDYRLVSFVFGLPLSSKLGHGYTKRILRDAMTGIIPEDIRTRTLKIGFSAPMKEWFSNELSEFINDELSSKSFIESPHWNGKLIQLFAQEKIKKKNWSHHDTMKFWPLLNAHILLSKTKIS